jgi:hypothetical protein
MEYDLITGEQEPLGRYFTTKQLAAIIHRDPESLHNARITGKGDYPGWVRVGRQVLYPEAEVRAWLTKRKVFHTTAEADAATDAMEDAA